MKTSLAILGALLYSATALAQTTTLVVDSEGNFMGRFVKETDTHVTYYSEGDTEALPKSEGYRAKSFSAATDGGFLWPTCEGSINIRQRPTTKSTVVESWPINSRTSYNAYDCVGYKEGAYGEHGWYKVKTPKGRVGWVREDLVRWDIGYLE